LHCDGSLRRRPLLDCSGIGCSAPYFQFPASWYINQIAHGMQGHFSKVPMHLFVAENNDVHRLRSRGLSSPSHPCFLFFILYIFLAGYSVSAAPLLMSPIYDFLRDFWIQTQSAAVASWCANDLATHPPCSATHPPCLATHPPSWPPIPRNFSYQRLHEGS